MSILAVAGQPSDMEIGAPSAASGGVDAYSRSRMEAQNTVGFIGKRFAAGRDVWAKIRENFTGNIFTDTTSGRVGTALRSGDTELLRQVGTGANQEFTFEGWDGAAWVQIGTAYRFTTGIHDVCFRLDASATGRAQVYVDAALIGEVTGDFSGLPAPDNFVMQSFNTTYARMNMSEVIIASHDILYARLKVMNLTGAGALQEWIGAVGDINAYNSPDTSFIHSDTAGQNATYAKAGLAADSLNVSALVLSGRLRNTGVAPGGVDGLVRVGATNYAADMGVLGTTFQNGRQAIWHDNPATGQPWTRTDAGAAELGVRSR